MAFVHRADNVFAWQSTCHILFWVPFHLGTRALSQRPSAALHLSLVGTAIGLTPHHTAGESGDVFWIRSILAK